MKQVVIRLLRLYQTVLSPILPFNHCRFYPSCSQYAVEAVEKHGAFAGSWLALKRLLRCHPFHRGGIYDPVPEPKLPTQKGF
jgi:uncharacterized protein